MADYGASDTSTTTLGANQFPISEVYVPNTGLRAVEGGAVSTDSGGKTSAPVNVSVKNSNANGQATMANSAPVVIASDQSAVPISGTVALTGGSNNVGNVGVIANAGVTFYNGTSDFHLVSAASNNATFLKASNGGVYGWSISNTNAAWRYVKLYNKASAPAPATDSALLVRTVGIPPGGVVNYFNMAGSKSYSTGIALATTTGSSDTDNTSVGAGDLIIQVDWS
jgi:hypothetical protein